MTYEAFKEEYGITLNPQQDEAVQSVEGPVLLLAVPGSGKTTVLVTRLGYMLLCCQIPPESILTMTYTVAAARDMRARFAAMFGEDLSAQLEFRTINGVSSRIIRQFERMLGRRAFDVLSDERQVLGLIRDIYGEVNRGDHPTDSDIKAVRTGIAYAKNQMLGPDAIKEMDDEIKGFSKIYSLYNGTLRKRGLMDYDDQMVYALQILRQYPEVKQVFCDRYRYLCVDEAQDTSKIQHEIIRTLARGNLFMVGDEDQSIYGFRAAYPEALLHMERDYPGTRVLLMETNYRSLTPIVAAADRFIQANRNRHPKHMVASRGDGAPVREIKLKTRRNQYSYLLKVAQDCPEETAVLFRDNDCALPLIDLLEREGADYQCRKMDIGFFSHRLTRDVTDIIHLAYDQTDAEAFLRVYYKFSAGISRKAAEAAIARGRGQYPLMALLSEDRSLSDWTRGKCQGLYTHLLSMTGERGDKAIYRIMQFMGYGDYLESTGMDGSRVGILSAIGEHTDTPLGLLERLTELQTLILNKEDSDAKFILSTIHSAKGLEYNRVFLLDVLDGILPKEGDDVDEDEERRLFYVGMTRAKNQLNLFTFEDSRLDSRFSDEVFGRKTRSAKHCVNLKPPVSRTSPIQAPPKVDMMLDAKFISGAAVTHKSFGPGEIVSRQGDIAVISFQSGKTAKLSLHTALRGGLLSLTES